MLRPKLPLSQLPLQEEETSQSRLSPAQPWQPWQPQQRQEARWQAQFCPEDSQDLTKHWTLNSHVRLVRGSWMLSEKMNLLCVSATQKASERAIDFSPWKCSDSVGSDSWSGFWSWSCWQPWAQLSWAQLPSPARPSVTNARS